MGHIAYIGFGSNLDDKIGYCEKAIAAILDLDNHKLLAKSSFYKTEPLGYPDQDWFINGVIQIESDLEPYHLFYALKEIESRLGRTNTVRWGPREIDLDLLIYEDWVIQTVDLQIPHPRIQERQFVLIPLAEIDPHLIHPILHKTIRELLKEIKEDQGVERL